MIFLGQQHPKLYLDRCIINESIRKIKIGLFYRNTVYIFLSFERFAAAHHYVCCALLSDLCDRPVALHDRPTDHSSDGVCG